MKLRINYEGGVFLEREMGLGTTVSLIGKDGSTVTYKPMDTVRGPMFQSESSTGPGDSR